MAQDFSVGTAMLLSEVQQLGRPSHTVPREHGTATVCEQPRAPCPELKAETSHLSPLVSPCYATTSPTGKAQIAAQGTVTATLCMAVKKNLVLGLGAGGKAGAKYQAFWALPSLFYLFYL